MSFLGHLRNDSGSRMEPYYLSANIGNATTLCIAPATDEKIVQSGQDIADTSGYFLFETDRSQEPPSVRIMAQILTDEAAMELGKLLNME